MSFPVFILLVQLDADVSIHGLAVPPFDQGSHRVPAYERVQLFILAMPFDRASHGGCKRIVASHGVKASIAKAYQHKFTLQRSDMHSHGDGTDYVHHVVARQSVQRERIPFLRMLSQQLHVDFGFLDDVRYAPKHYPVTKARVEERPRALPLRAVHIKQIGPTRKGCKERYENWRLWKIMLLTCLYR